MKLKKRRFCVFLLGFIIIITSVNHVCALNKETDSTNFIFNSEICEGNSGIDLSIITDENGQLYTETTSFPTGYQFASIKNGIYHIKNCGSYKYIDIHGPNTDMIHQYFYSIGTHECWEITSQDDYYLIKSVYSNKYIGVSNYNLGNDNINLFSSISDQTKWYILVNDSKYIFVPYL